MATVPNPDSIAALIRQNAWAILVAGFAAYHAFIGQGAKIERHDKDIHIIERKLEGRRVFVGDSAAIINYLCEQDEGCRERYAVVKVPE